MGLAVGAAALAGACGGGEDRPGAASASGSVSGSASGSVSGSHAHEDTKAAFKESEATSTVQVDAADFVFQGLPPTVKGPNVLFKIDNTGKADHEFVVVGPDGEPVAEVGAFDPGKSKTLAVKLTPGAYTVQCLIKEGDKTHADLGMKTTLNVTA